MSQTAQYLAIRDAMISCRERFRDLLLNPGDLNPAAYAKWASAQAELGFEEVDAILADPANQE